MRRVLFAGTLIAALFVWPTLGLAQAQGQSTKASAVAMTDQKFVQDVYQGGLGEIEVAKLAKDKASSAEVKAFADRLVTDHSRFNDELKALAAQKTVTLPTSVSPKHKALHARLDKLSGPAFERTFMQEMVTAHRMGVNNFRQESKTGKDADVTAWASKTLPTLQEHLAAAERVSGAVGTSGKAGNVSKVAPKGGRVRCAWRTW